MFLETDRKIKKGQNALPHAGPGRPVMSRLSFSYTRVHGRVHTNTLCFFLLLLFLIENTHVCLYVLSADVRDAAQPAGCLCPVTF